MEFMKMVKDRLKRIDQQKDIENIRLDLYSLYTHIILTKDLFNKNSEMESFLNDIGIACKPYLLKSRTTILGEVLRKIQKAEGDGMSLFVNQLYGLIKTEEESMTESEEKKEDNKQGEAKERKTTNYMNEILKKYSRTGK